MDQSSFTSLIDTNGVETFSQPDLEAILVDSYSSLFSKDSLDRQIQTELIDDLGLSLNDLEQEQCEGLFTNRVRTGPGKPGKSWNFVVAFSRTGKSWKKATGPGKSWKSVQLE